MIQPDLADPLTGPFWQGAREGKLQVSWCGTCDQAVWYPRACCNICGGILYWQTLSGQGTLIAWSEVTGSLNPDFNGSYLAGLVSPRDAPCIRLVTQLVDCRAQDLRCDMAVAVRFRELQPQRGAAFVAPVFTPDIR